METSKLSILGALGGLGVIIFFDVRYLWIYYDLSQALDFTAIGMVMIFLAYVYNWQTQRQKDLDKLTRRLDSLASFFMGEEKETIKAQAKGEA